MLGVKQYIYMALAVGVIGYVWFTNTKIDGLKTDIESLKKDILVADVNAKECDETLQEQNIVIQNLAVDYNESITAFDEYKKLPAKVKIKKERVIIYRDINITKPREERNCEEYKTIESNTYMLDWNK